MRVAVEGKSTETDRKTVKQWLGPGSENKHGVLCHWLDKISEVTSHSFAGFNDPAVLRLVYQMVHRVASACHGEAHHRAVVYQVFDVEGLKNLPIAEYEQQLQDVAESIGAEKNITIALNWVSAKPTENYAKLKQKLSSSDAEAHPVLIRRAIIQGGLFEFGSSTFTRIANADF